MAPPLIFALHSKQFSSHVFFLYIRLRSTGTPSCQLSDEKKWKKHKSAHKLKRQQKNKQTSYAHFVNDYYYFNKTSGE